MSMVNDTDPRNPLWLFNISKPRALLIVAHPDDETIFAGGLVLSSQNTKWTIICCIDESCQKRKNEFFCACRFFEQYTGNIVEPVFLAIKPQHNRSNMYLQLCKALKVYAKEYDIVFSHNRQGEYGHEDHKLVHHSVIESIHNPNIWLFISPGSKNVNQDELRSQLPNGNMTLDLSSEIITMKKEVFCKCHKSQAALYGYESISGQLLNTDLKETLYWYFESPGSEAFTFCH